MTDEGVDAAGTSGRRESIYNGRIVELVRLDGRWEVALHPPGVAILVMRGRQVLGVRQHRHPLGKATWELPAGLVDPGETPERAAERELAEEVGLGGTLKLITRMYTSPGFTDEVIHLFEATDLEPRHADPDEGEVLELAWLDVQAAWEGVQRGNLITSSPTLVGLTYAISRLGLRCT